ATHTNDRRTGRLRGGACHRSAIRGPIRTAEFHRHVLRTGSVRIGDDGMFVNVDDGNIFTFRGVRVRFPEQAQPSKILHTTINVRS
ncbi:MAG: hypothetical protein ACQKBV_01680, partial [Puniceicoccales bacterium]